MSVCVRVCCTKTEKLLTRNCCYSTWMRRVIKCWWHMILNVVMLLPSDWCISSEIDTTWQQHAFWWSQFGDSDEHRPLTLRATFEGDERNSASSNTVYRRNVLYAKTLNAANVVLKCIHGLQAFTLNLFFYLVPLNELEWPWTGNTGHNSGWRATSYEYITTETSEWPFRPLQCINNGVSIAECSTAKSLS